VAGLAGNVPEFGLVTGHAGVMVHWSGSLRRGSALLYPCVTGFALAIGWLGVLCVAEGDSLAWRSASPSFGLVWIGVAHTTTTFFFFVAIQAFCLCKAHFWGDFI